MWEYLKRELDVFETEKEVSKSEIELFFRKYEKMTNMSNKTSSIGGTLIKVDELASTLQVCLDSGAKKVLLPITSAGDLGTVPSDLVGAFSLIFYSSAEEAVFKALGVE